MDATPPTGDAAGQAVRKLIDGPGFNHLIEGRQGYVLFNANDYYIGRCLAEYGEWSPGETDLFQRLVRPGHYVVDVGAHIGIHTLTFARLVGRQGKVFAFEPQRLLHQVLAANVALNSLDNVHSHHMALGAKSGSVWLADNLDYSREANFGGVPLAAIARKPDDERPRYRLPIVRLDDFYDQPRLDFLKIDVEGMEANVLQGAERLIRTHRPILYVENDRAEKSRALVELLRSRGYRLRLHKPPLYSPTNYAGSRTDLFPGIVSCNLLCIHESRATSSTSPR
ncbi:MAG: FkbM family methyltransferase [Acidobacteria bacterium]|nr:FkbM family methyltransferase [Acidobacteriota bacterium]